MTTLGTVIGRGASGSRPAAGTAGQLYYDTTNSKLQRDNGSTWDDCEPASSAALVGAAYTRKTGDYTTTSTTFTNVDGTNMSFTKTTGAHRVRVGFIGSVYLSSTNTIAFDVTIDGTRVGGDYGIAIWNVASAGNAIPIAFTYLSDVLTAASHTFVLQWKVTAGTGTIEGAATGGAWCQFWIEETSLTA
jgi:hypothetical protein